VCVTFSAHFIFLGAIVLTIFGEQHVLRMNILIVLGAGGNMILKYILKESGMNLWTKFMWLKIKPSDGLLLAL
jgi:hypothetical protein